MTKEEYLFVSLAEECAEVQQRICKALRFGLEEKQVDGPSANPSDSAKKTNRERILEEMLDLTSLYRMLLNNDFLPTLEEGEYEAKHREKIAKVYKYYEYAKSLKHVTEQK